MPDRKPTQPSADDSSITDEIEPNATVEDHVRHAGGVTEMVRRAVMVGVEAVLLTEGGIRKTVADLKLPKEAFGYLAAQAERTRREASRIVRKELRRFLNSEAFKQQLIQALSDVTLEVKAEVRLKPSATGPKPDINARVRVKQSGKEDREA